MAASPDEIVTFWQNAGPKKWFQKSDAFDAEITSLFQATVQDARDGKLDEWIDQPNSCLALIILLDQFPRNMFRGTPEMFSSDAKAVAVTKRAVELGHDVAVDPAMRAFVYMPLMHSETLEDQTLSVELFRALGAPENVKHAIEHAEIVEKYGRFPHRNAVLGRASAPDEVAFLENGGFAG